MHVAIIQPYLPRYRVALFDEIARQLEERGDNLTVLHGQPTGVQGLRGDSVNASWSRNMQLHPRLLRRGLRWGSRLPRSEFDVVVCDLSIKNLDAWRLMVTRPRTLIFWGHGKSYVTPGGRLERRLKTVMVKRAAKTMTYVDSGRDWLLSRGLEAERVVAIGNSTDTHAVREGLRDALAGGVDQANRAHHALYVGGLDADKRVPFLVQAAAHAHHLDERFCLTVAGSGSDENLLETDKNTYITHVPSVTPRKIGELAAASSAIWMPGRVGLVALDAHAAGLPIISLRSSRHAPEVELVPEGMIVWAQESPEGYASDALRVMADPISPVSSSSSTVPTIRTVATKFVQTVRDVSGAK